jgi:integrase
MPLRVIYRRAIEFEQVATNPVARVPLPAVRGRRDRIATSDQADRMLAALPAVDQLVWGLAFFAGLRRGEARGLRWADVDFDAGVIHVERAWCNHSRQMTLPKSRAAIRRVPMAGRLRQLLLEHRLRVGRPAQGDLIAAGARPGVPIAACTLHRHATDAWASLEDVPAGFGLHEARHTYASLMIAAGVQAKALCEFMGHASITITLDRYGHLFPGAHAEAAALLDRYLEAQTSGR